MQGIPNNMQGARLGPGGQQMPGNLQQGQMPTGGGGMMSNMGPMVGNQVQNPNAQMNQMQMGQMNVTNQPMNSMNNMVPIALFYNNFYLKKIKDVFQITGWHEFSNGKSESNVTIIGSY